MLVASTSCLFKYCFYRSLRMILYLYIVLMCFDELSERKKWEVIVTRAGDDVGRDYPGGIGEGEHGQDQLLQWQRASNK